MIDVKGDALFSPDRAMRHRLDRWWSDEPRALVCMANPSDAGAERNDPTIHNLLRLLRPVVGIGGFTVVNWEPYIATDPKDLHRWRDATDIREMQGIHEENLALVASLATVAPLRIIAWGEIVPLCRHTSRTLAAMSSDHQRALHAFGFTKSGAPKHPMARGKSRIPDGALPVIWRTPRPAVPHPLAATESAT